MPITKAGDIHLYYEIHGSGEPLVLIMGYTMRGDHWSDTPLSVVYNSH